MDGPDSSVLEIASGHREFSIAAQNRLPLTTDRC